MFGIASLLLLLPAAAVAWTSPSSQFAILDTAPRVPWFYPPQNPPAGHVNATVVWHVNSFTPGMCYTSFCVGVFDDENVAVGDCPDQMPALAPAGVTAPTCHIGCTPSYTPTTASRTGVACVNTYHGDAATASLIITHSSPFNSLGTYDFTAPGFVCEAGHSGVDHVYMDTTDASRVWPDSMMTIHNACTNPTPVPNEQCVRKCSNHGQCGAGTFCDAVDRVCVCSMLDTRAAMCGGQGVCGTSGRRGTTGLCFCDPTRAYTHGTCASIAPDTTYRTDNMQWATRNTYYPEMNALPKGDISPSDALWSFGTRGTTPQVPIVWTMAAPPLLKCNSGWHGAMCDQRVDQLASVVCGGRGASLVRILGATESPSAWRFWIYNLQTDPTSIYARATLALATENSIVATQTDLYCDCPYAYSAPVIAHMESLVSGVRPMLPGASCAQVDRDRLYCSKMGVYNEADGTCKCAPQRSGADCSFACSNSYCSGHARSCNTTATQNMCGVCDAGWGPAQRIGNAIDADPTYAYRWCNTPVGADIAPRLTPSVDPVECNGVGFAVDPAHMQVALAGLGASVVAFGGNSLAVPFDTHPLRIRRQLELSAAQLAPYQAMYDATERSQCVYCEDGWDASGGECLVSTCRAWTACHASDVACIAAAPHRAYTTGLKCGGTMFEGSLRPRGTCTRAGRVMQCACEDGYGGADCGEVRCSWANGRACNGRGTCDEARNRCVCAAGWVGAACEMKDDASSCSAHGQTVRVNPPFVGNPTGEASPYAYKLADNADLTRTVWY